MPQLILLHGMKRSGNHAITQWLQAQGEFEVFNNVIPIAPILRGEKSIPNPQPFSQWQQTYTQKKAAIISLEDHDLRTQLFEDAPQTLINILLIRDPINLFASRIRKASQVDNPAYPRQTGTRMDRVIALWKLHAKEFLQQTQHLNNRHCIYFNTWFAEPDYRKTISQRLDLVFTDRGYSAVSAIGGGSSFDGVRYNGNNLTMQVLTRKQQLNTQERRVLEDILADPELLSLADQIALMPPSSA